MTAYINGKPHMNVYLSGDEIDSLIADVRWDEDTDPATFTALNRLKLHRDGPPPFVDEAIEAAADSWLEWPSRHNVNSDAVRIKIPPFNEHTASWVTVTVSPDGDVDDDTGRMVDCTSVSATWHVDWQSVEFELDSHTEQVVLDFYWEEQARYR
jgi:hypothetical protein